MISLSFDVFFRIFGPLVAELRINELLICCQDKTRGVSISAKNTAKYRHGIHATSQDYRQAHNLIKKPWQRNPLLIYKLSPIQSITLMMVWSF